MKKKIIAIVVCVLMALTVLAGCNKDTFKQDAVSSIDESAAVTSNGSMSVKIGNYLYYINGYEGLTDIDNTFGTPDKSAIYRVELNEDGTMKADTKVCIAPKNVVSSYASGGIYIYNGWIYYATPNTDKDKTGVENTTYLDFFRTSLDASVTEKILTIEGRSAQYMFSKGYLVYVLEKSVYSVNCEAKKAKDREPVTLVDDKLTTAQFIACPDGGAFEGYILYTQTLPEELEEETYNEYCVVKVDGSESKVLVTGTTFAATTADVTKVFKISPINYLVESDGLVVYYTKAYTTGSTSTTVGTFCYKFTSSSFEFNKDNEKQLSTTALSTILPVSYDKGVLVLENSVVDQYTYQSFTVEQLIGRSVTVRFVCGDYVYYTETSTTAALFRFRTDGTGVEQKVFTDNIATTWLYLDVCGGYVYYFDSDYNYNYRYNLNGALMAEPELVGVMTAEDLAAIAAAEAETEE